MVTTTQVIHKVLVDIVHKATGVTMEQKISMLLLLVINLKYVQLVHMEQDLV
jgi:hypothetical protein